MIISMNTINPFANYLVIDIVERVKIRVNWLYGKTIVLLTQNCH